MISVEQVEEPTQTARQTVSMAPGERGVLAYGLAWVVVRGVAEHGVGSHVDGAQVADEESLQGHGSPFGAGWPGKIFGNFRNYR